MEKITHKMKWGELIITPERILIKEDDEKRCDLFTSLPKCHITEEDGKFGLADKNSIVLPCVFDQGEQVNDSWYFRKGSCYCWLKFRGGVSTLGDVHDPAGDFFVENGKVGWKSSEKTFVPAEYDEVSTWGSNELFCCKKDGRWLYFNEEGKEVLTFVRPVDAEAPRPHLYDYLETMESKAVFISTNLDSLSDGTNVTRVIKYRNGERWNDMPFSFRDDKQNSVTTFEYRGDPDADDNNVIKIGGNWVRVDRYSRRDICQMMANPADDIPMNDWDLRNFNSGLVCELAGFWAHGQGSHPLQECDSQLQKMPTFNTTWQFLIKIWLSPGEKLSTEELRWFNDRVRNHPSNNGSAIAVGHDEALAQGEVRMLVVTYWQKEYFNTPQFIDDWKNACDRLPLKDVKKALVQLHEGIQEKIPARFREEVWLDQLIGTIHVDHRAEKSWEEIEKTFDFFKQLGCPCHFLVAHSVCRHIDPTLRWSDKLSKEEAKELEYYYKCVEWGLRNGSLVNCLYEGDTPLDCIDNLFNDTDENKMKVTKKKLQFYSKLRALLVENGALHKDELSQDDADTDYQTELRRLNTDTSRPPLPTFKEFDIKKIRCHEK